MRHLMAESLAGGARTVTLQSTRMGHGLYRPLGFVAVGRYEEWVPENDVVSGPAGGRPRCPTTKPATDGHNRQAVLSSVERQPTTTRVLRRGPCQGRPFRPGQVAVYARLRSRAQRVPPLRSMRVTSVRVSLLG